MDVGSLNKKITLQVVSLVPDGGGGNAESWADLVTVWAEVKPASITPFLMAAQPQQQITHKIKIRYRADVSVKNRVVFGGRVLEIESVLNVDEAGDFLQISCIENGV